jgi:hypothetical protein
MPGSQEYDANYDSDLVVAGVGTYPTPVNSRGMIKYICQLLGGSTQNTKVTPIQVGNGTVGGARLWSASGVPSAQTFTSTTGDIYFRTDGAAATAIYIATAGGTPGTWAAVT